MFIVSTFLFVIAAALSFVEERLSDRVRTLTLVGFVLAMITMATFKDIATTADAENYVEYFYNNDDPLIELMTEPTYIYLARFLILIGVGIVPLFFIYAVITIPVKLYALQHMSPYIFTALMVYIPVYYLLQDVIQIRAGAAAGFLLLSLYMTCEKRYAWAATALVVGTLFHYSCMVFLPVMLWRNRSLGVVLRCVLGTLVPLGFLMYFMGIDLLSFLPSTFMGGKVDFYKESAETGGDWSEYIVPYKNLYLLVKCLLLFLCLIFYNTIKSHSKYVDTCLIMLGLSIFICVSMATIPVVAGRISDLYGLTDAITFTFILYFVKPSWLVRCFIGIVGLYMLGFNYLHGGFVV